MNIEGRLLKKFSMLVSICLTSYHPMPMFGQVVSKKMIMFWYLTMLLLVLDANLNVGLL